MSEFVNISDELLAILVRQTKQGIIDILDAGGVNAWVPDPKVWECGPAGIFEAKVMVLQGLENEIKGRGLNPAHPVFGIDLMGEMAELKAEVLAE